MSNDLVPQNLGPGMVPARFAEMVLQHAANCDDPAVLYDAATTAAGLGQKWNGHGREKNELRAAQLYCEIELGQLLGPNPGHGPGRGRKDPDTDVSIPPQRVEEFRRFYGWRDELVEAVRNGKRSRGALLMLVDQLTHPSDPQDETPSASQNETPDIRRGDFREVLADISDDSVPLILTDPPYPAEFLPLWSDLAAFAARVLVPGGSLVAYSGQGNLPAVLSRLSEHLRYWWVLALSHGHGSQNLPGKFVTIGWKPIVWYVKEHRRDSRYVADRLGGSPPRKGSGPVAEWSQGVNELEPLIRTLSGPNELIVDPFAGSGTVGHAVLRFGRSFLGAEIT